MTRDYIEKRRSFEFTLTDIAEFAFGEALADNQVRRSDDSWVRALALKHIRHDNDIPSNKHVALTHFDWWIWNNIYQVDTKWMTTYPAMEDTGSRTETDAEQYENKRGWMEEFRNG